MHLSRIEYFCLRHAASEDFGFRHKLLGHKPYILANEMSRQNPYIFAHVPWFFLTARTSSNIKSGKIECRLSLRFSKCRVRCVSATRLHAHTSQNMFLKLILLAGSLSAVWQIFPMKEKIFAPWSTRKDQGEDLQEADNSGRFSTRMLCLASHNKRSARGPVSFSLSLSVGAF